MAAINMAVILENLHKVIMIANDRPIQINLLRQCRITRHHLNTVFDALILSRLRYAIPALSGFL